VRLIPGVTDSRRGWLSLPGLGAAGRWGTRRAVAARLRLGPPSGAAGRGPLSGLPGAARCPGRQARPGRG